MTGDLVQCGPGKLIMTVRQSRPGVLIVDDDVRVRSFLRTALEDNAGVVEAGTGEEALEILETPSSTLDLMLLDYVLPTLSGLEILQVTRRRWPWIPVIILTAFGSEEVAVQALRAGANDYLRKPVQLDTLRESVRVLMAGRPERARGGPATLDQPAESRSAHPNIRQALIFMHQHFAEEITLNDVAREAALSRFHFCRLFRRETGVLFHEYLHRLRVNRAKALLVNRHLTISEVAFTVGFNDLSHFDRTFRRIVGSSPTEYRGSLRCA